MGFHLIRRMHLPFAQGMDKLLEKSSESNSAWDDRKDLLTPQKEDKYVHKRIEME